MPSGLWPVPPTYGALAKALAKAQRDLRPAVKDSTNPHFKSKYADMASVWDACRGALSSNGLSVVQMPAFADGKMSLTTMLLHESGEHIDSTLSIPLAQANAQTIGSAITYARRYALMAIVGIAPDEDDDGNAAVPPNRATRSAAESYLDSQAKAVTPTVDAVRLQRAQDLWKTAQERKWTREQFTEFTAKHGVKTLREATLAEIEALEAALVKEDDIKF